VPELPSKTNLDALILQKNLIVWTPKGSSGCPLVPWIDNPMTCAPKVANAEKKPTPEDRTRLKCVAMVSYMHIRHCARGSLALLLLMGVAAFAQSAPDNSSGPGAQNSPSGQDSQTIQIQSEEQQQKQTNSTSKPLPLKPGVPGMGRNHRLILKDGSYQMVRDYQIVGDRVRYLSQERGEWEELPSDLVDWDATKKWEKEHADLVEEDTSPAMKEAESIDKEESEERAEQNARMPKVSEGLELPDEDGVFVLDTFHGTPELVKLVPTDMSLEAKNRKGIAVLNPLATQKANLELEGAHAKVHLHVNDPAIYLSLGVDDEKEPVLTHPITVNTNGAKAVNGGKHGAHSAQSGFAIVRVDERQAVRIVGAVHVSPTGTVTQDENTIATKAEVLPGKHWLKIEPAETLTIGEYALVEILSPSDISESVWDFRVDPRLPDNVGSIQPITRQPRDQ
jgi:hypothetical protein